MKEKEEEKPLPKEVNELFEEIPEDDTYGGNNLSGADSRSPESYPEKDLQQDNDDQAEQSS